MNLLDFFIILPICFFAYRGFVSGFIKEILSIIGIILAVFVTFEYMDSLSPFFYGFFDNPDYAAVAAGIFLFILVVAVVQLIAYAAKRFLEVINLNFINRLAGLAFGAIKSGIVISVMLLLLAGFNLPGEEARSGSISYPVIIYLAPAVFDIVASVYPGAEDFISTIEQAIEENNPIKNLPIFENSEP